MIVHKYTSLLLSSFQTFSYQKTKYLQDTPWHYVLGKHTILSFILTYLDFVDDIALLSSTFKNTQNLRDNLEGEAKSVGLLDGQ